MQQLMPAGSWFVGCGNMGGAMVEGWRKTRVDLSGLTAISPSGRVIPGVNVKTSIPKGSPSWCFLGFKPQTDVDEGVRLIWEWASAGAT